MGLTLHYQGQLRSEESYQSFLLLIERYAASLGWPSHPIAESQRELVRMLQPEDPDAPEFEDVYVGPTRGLYLLPHVQCEPLKFEFDRDLFMQDWCKTQFAGAKTHADIVHLFQSTEDMFEMLDVQDEAEFWDGADTPQSREQLATLFQRTLHEIKQAAEESPGASVGVLTPSGRILDVLVE